MILIMGLAGSGKGTQGKQIVDKFDLKLISMGEVLRQHADAAQRQRMLNGELLADDEIIDIVDRLFQALPDNQEVLMDGFPRTIPQAEWALKQAQAGRFDLNLAIHLTASKQALKDRLLKRARVDDIEQAIDARFDEYERSTKPILKWLEDNGIKVVNVDAERPVEPINAELSTIVADNLKKT